MANKETVTTKWLSNMAFESEINGHKIVVDADPGSGGEELGPRPKMFLLAALGGCTGMDVVSILRKMNVDLDDFRVTVEGDLTDDAPKHFNKMHVVYEFTGKDLPLDKIQRAVGLSEEKYCGVRALYKKAMELTSEIRINNS